MIGMVLVTHGALAEEFRAALEHVVGAQKNLATICIGPDDDMEKRREDIVDAIVKVDTGDGVALLTDMFGGTPSNLAISLLEKDKVEVVAGINLPMLIKLAVFVTTSRSMLRCWKPETRRANISPSPAKFCRQPRVKS